MQEVVAIYARISQEKDDIDVSIDQQIEQGKVFAKSKNMDYLIYKDEGYSGTLPASERPAMYKLLQDIVKKDSKIKILWGREMFRLYRGNTPKIEIQMVCKKHNVDIYYAEKKLDDSDPMEKFMDNMLGVMGEFYVDLTKQNVKQAIKKNFDDGKAHGVAPYGYKTDGNKRLVIDEEQAKWVRKMFEWHKKGMGVTSIATKLMDMGVPTMYSPDHVRFSKKWDRTTVYGILKNKLYYGIRTHNDWKTVNKKRELVSTREIEVPELAIIDESTFNESLYAFEELKSYTGKRTWHKYLLADLMHCGNCGSRYVGRADNRNNDVYRCTTKRKKSGCKNRDIRKNYIESFVWNYISDGSILLEKLLEKQDDDNGEKRKELELELEELNQTKEKLNVQSSNIIRLVVQGHLSDSELAGEKKRIEKEKIECSVKINNLKEQIEALNAEKNLKSQIEDDFKKLTGYRYGGVLSSFDDFIKYRVVQDKALYLSYPFNEKQLFLSKYIETILVNYVQGIFKLTFKFKPPLSNRVVYMDRNFYVAVDAFTRRKYDLEHPKKHNLSRNLNNLFKTIEELEKDISLGNVE